MLDPKKIKWSYYHTRRRSFWYGNLLFKALTYKSIDMDNVKYWLRYVGIFCHDACVSPDDWDKSRLDLLAAIKKQSDFLLQQINNAYVEHKKLISLVADIYKIEDFLNYNNNQLIDFLNQYKKQFDKICVYATLALFVEDDLAQEISEQVEEDEYNVIMTPVKNGRGIEENISLLEMAIKNKAGKNIDSDLEDHWINFAWLKDVGYYGEYFTKDYYVDRLEQIAEPQKELDKLLAERKEHADKFQSILDKYKKDKQLTDLIRTINEAIYFRSFRSEEWYRSGIYLKNLFSEIATRLKLKNEDFYHLSISEVIAMLEGGESIDQEIIEKRKFAFVAVFDGDQEFISQGQEAKDLSEQIDVHSEEDDDLQGQPAFKGLVKGSVVVVMGPQDFDKVKKGDVLVSMSTQPDYVPILKKVSAIVTEEGGVLCHASVISRELKIPCVIGTKVATKVLKDGDIVEVDAHKGIVKILKQ